MKKRSRRVLIGLSVVSLVGIITYRKATQLDLHSGTLRTQWRAFGIQMYATAPKDTSISKAVKKESGRPKWFTIAERDFEIIPMRISFCYTKLLGHVQRIDSGFMKPDATAFLAKAALQELDQDRDICATSGHMGRVWEQLLDGDPPTFSAETAALIWNTTKPNETELATPRRSSD